MDDNIISIAKFNNGAIKHGISPKQNHLISVFTSLENTLTDKRKRYLDKVQSLLLAWEQIVNFVSIASKESPQPFFDSLFINTLRYVLRADWPKSISAATKTHLSVTLQRFITILNKSEAYHSILEQCRLLESIVKDPWGQLVLSKIIKAQDVDLDECVEYFKLENGKVVVVRLEMLLLSKCEDIAVNLSKACLNTYTNFNDDLEGYDTLDFTQNEIDYITDIYFSCLFKTKKKPELIAEIKKYQLDDGLRLLQRYRKSSVGGEYNENCKCARVWKYNEKLIELLSNTLLANAVLHEELLESQSQLEDLIIEWAAVQTVDGTLSTVALEMIRKFVLIAPSSKCIYPFCSFLIRNGNCKEQDFNMVARCLIRAINQNMNEVEQHRVNRERDKLKETYGQLSKGFLLLSDLLNECQNIYKECLLTSFSLTPTRDCLKTIEDFVTKLSNIEDIVKESESEKSPNNELEQTADSSSVEVEKSTILDTPSEKSESCFNTPDEIIPISQPLLKSDSNSVETNCSSEKPPDVEFSSYNSLKDSGTSLHTKEHDTTVLNEIFESIGLSENGVDQIREEIDPKQMNKQLECKKGSTSGYIIELENLKLDESMGGDLNTILSYRRYHMLSWDLEWSELKANCEQYLEDFEKKDFDDVELKYLDLDYNQFKDQPINYDDLCGIEKGYEQFAFSPSDSEEEASSTKRSGLSSVESDEDILLIHRKRKKVFSSDSDEPRNKRKRGRKRKPKTDEPCRRNSQKSDIGSSPEDDKILDTIESVIAESSNAENLKELRSFRITSMKSTDGSKPFIDDNHNESSLNTASQKLDELNDFLADSCKSLDCVAIPPISPRFNVYDVLLENTLVPSDSEKRLPKCEDLTFNNENIFTENITTIEPNKKVEKPRKPAVKEKNSVVRKKSQKGPKPNISMVPRATDSFSNYSSGQTVPYASLLSNDKLFIRKCGPKEKNGKKLTENQVRDDLIVQLPKLSDTFNKCSYLMNPANQNISFTSYLKQALINPPSSPQINGRSNENQKYNACSQTSPNVVNETNDSDNIEEIKHFLKNYKSPNETPIHTANTTQVFQQPNTVENTCQTDISPEGLWNTTLPGVKELLLPSESSNSKPISENSKCGPYQNNVPKVIPTTSKLVSVSSAIISRPAGTVSSGASNMCNNNVSSKRSDTEIVNQILYNYQSEIAKHPELKNVQAPRKGVNSSNRPRKARSRTKNDLPAVKSDETLRTDVYPSIAEINVSKCAPTAVSQQTSVSVPNYNVTTSFNAYSTNNALYNTSSIKLPPTDASSQVTTFSAKQSQYHYNVPSVTNSKFTEGKFLDSVIVNVLDNSNTLKALLTQRSPATTCSVNKIPISDLRFNTSPPKTYNRLNTTSSPAVNQIPYSTELTNGQQVNSPVTRLSNHAPHMQKSTQQLKGCEGLTNNFEVRLPRIDSEINVANYTTNNLQYSCSNKMPNDSGNASNAQIARAPSSHTYASSVSNLLLPSVVLPMLPNTVTQTVKNNSTVNMSGNYQMNNFTVPSGTTHSVTNTQNVQANMNSVTSVNNITNNHFSTNAEFSSNTPSINHDLSLPVLYATVNSHNSNDINDMNGVCISIPETSLPDDFLESYPLLSFIQNGMPMDDNSFPSNSGFYSNGGFNGT